MSDPADLLRLEPEDLDGHTLDELDDYLDRDRVPADPSIDNSPSCQIALGALQRLRDIAGDYLDRDDASTGTDADWISSVLASLPFDTRAGRHFPYDTLAQHVHAHVTEAALRGLIRATGDDVPGLLIGTVDIRVDESGQCADLWIEAAVVWGTSLPGTDAVLRTRLREVLPLHAPFAVGRIDLRIVELIGPETRPRRST